MSEDERREALALMQAVQDAPADAVAAFKLADWLEEHGSPLAGGKVRRLAPEKGGLLVLRLPPPVLKVDAAGNVVHAQEEVVRAAKAMEQLCKELEALGTPCAFLVVPHGYALDWLAPPADAGAPA